MYAINSNGLWLILIRYTQEIIVSKIKNRNYNSFLCLCNSLGVVISLKKLFHWIQYNICELLFAKVHQPILSSSMNYKNLTKEACRLHCRIKPV